MSIFEIIISAIFILFFGFLCIGSYLLQKDRYEDRKRNNDFGLFKRRE